MAEDSEQNNPASGLMYLLQATMMDLCGQFG
jgi:hypothetical protein